MTPVKITCRVRGKERESITAPDGVTAVLETPAGEAMAVMKPSRRILRIFPHPGVRFGVKFPGDRGMIYPEADLGRDPLKRKREYQTKEGRVVIEAEGIKE